MSFTGTNSLSTMSEKALDPFRAPTFDPVQYLNANLQVSTIPTPSSNRPQTASAVSLTELSSQAQTLLSQLNGQLTRFSATLNQLTDEILRSGGRLAYEVEVLRGDTSALSDVLGDGIRQDIRMFLPNGLPQPQRRKSSTAPSQHNLNATSPIREPADPGADAEKPEYISRLQTLTHVRTRLQEVIQVFNDAAEWELPPSELSKGSNISVSDPESAVEREAREKKGQEFMERIRAETLDLVEQGAVSHDPELVSAAFKRVEALRALAAVWKGTVEERARLKFVDNMSKMLQDKTGSARAA